MCGFVGVIGSKSAVHEIYDGLLAVQHRGQDAAGIITYDGARFHIKKGEGLVRDIFSAANMERLRGSVGVGHVRYPTVGSGGGEDAQPFTVNFPFGIVMAHNGNVANYDELRGELAHDALRHLYSGCDVEVVLNVFADGMAKAGGDGFTLEAYHAGVREVYRRVRGAYSVVGFVAGHGLFAFRDPYGIKPIVVGRRDDESGTAWAVASESVVLTAMGYEPLPPRPPGEALFIDLAGRIHVEPLAEPHHHPCVFEFVYFARPDCYLEGISVHASRLRMGRRMARRVREAGLDPEVVIPVPDSGCTPALALADELGLPYREGLGQEPLRRPDVHHGRRRRASHLDPSQAEHDRGGVPRAGRAARRRFDRARQHEPADRRPREVGRRGQGVLRVDGAASRPPVRLRHRHEHAA